MLKHNFMENLFNLIDKTALSIVPKSEKDLIDDMVLNAEFIDGYQEKTRWMLNTLRYAIVSRINNLPLVFYKSTPRPKIGKEQFIRYIKMKSIMHTHWLINIMKIDESKKSIILGRLAEAEEIFKISSAENSWSLYLHDIFRSLLFTYTEVAKYKRIKLYKLIYKVAFSKIK